MSSELPIYGRIGCSVYEAYLVLIDNMILYIPLLIH